MYFSKQWERLGLTYSQHLTVGETHEIRQRKSTRFHFSTVAPCVFINERTPWTRHTYSHTHSRAQTALLHHLALDL